MDELLGVFVMAEKVDRRSGSGRGKRGSGGGGGFERAAQVAQVLRDRDDHVAGGLALLGEIGVLDERTQKRLWELYQQGDQATRGFLQEQVARVVPEDPPRAEGGKGPTSRERASSVDPLELEVLKQLSSPHVDPGEVARHVRRFDPARLLGGSQEGSRGPGALMRFLSDAPLAVHRVQKRLLWAGVSILVFVVLLMATAVFVPAVVPYVGLGGVVLLALFMGVLLVRTATWIGRSAKRQGIDLDVYAQLPEDERRVLLVRRIGLRILDPHRKDAGPSVQGEPAAVPPGDEPEPAHPVPAQAPQEAALEVRGEPRLETDPGSSAEDPPAQEALEPVEEQRSAGPAPVTSNGLEQDGTGRFARFVRGARQAWNQAAESETAHRVGSGTKRVSREAGKRAKKAGRSAGKRISELKEQGEAEWERRRQARAAHGSPTPGKPTRKPVTKQAGGTGTEDRQVSKSGTPKVSKDTGRKTGKKAARKVSKRTAKKTGGKAAKTVKKPGKRSTARKGVSKKSAKRVGKRSTKRGGGSRGGSGRKRTGS